jgi:hypothetical protein
MATETRQVYDGQGNLIGEETFEVPDEVVATEQARTRLRELKAQGKANWQSPQDLADALEALLQVMGV